MSQIRTTLVAGFTRALGRTRTRVTRGVRWWAEHQAWPANEPARYDERTRR